MKKGLMIYALAAMGAILPASAQYSDVVNGITNVIMPAISGAKSYKGFVEADYTQGIGNYRTNFATISTTQGYQMTNWFYMGAGIGVDLLWSNVNDDWGNGWSRQSHDWNDQSYTSTAVMVPIFTDFRFRFGAWNAASFFIDLKIGAAFLCINDYVKIRNGYLTNTNYFYFQPAIGVRVPVNPNNAKQAINIGIHYRLLTSDYWSGYQSSVVLNGLGLGVSYEW